MYRFRLNTTRAVGGAVVLAPVAACGDLTVAPKSTITSANIFNDPASYQAFLAKLYAGLATSGQSGPAGDADIAGIDEGFGQYIRGYWQLQQLPTDETIIGWGDTGLPELNTQTWSSSNVFINAMYSRIYYQIALANQFLRETTDSKVAARGASAALKLQVQEFRLEARFLRALSYYHAVDLFGNVPLVDENADLSAFPRQAPRAEVFTFVETELKAIRAGLPPTSTGANYARASQAAVDMVLAHLYLNAKVYMGTDRSADARVAAELAIGSGATLDPNFIHMFSADNQTSPELIFTVPFDGVHTKTYGGTTFLVHAGIGGNMSGATYGVDGGWGGTRLRPEAVDRFEGGATGPDKRASTIMVVQDSKSIGSIGDFKQGYAYPKYRNTKSTGGAGSDLGFPDTDYPMFRLADAYLIYAEAVLRGGGGSRTTALGYINALRTRAYGSTAGNITDPQMTLQFILDERSRELLWEGHRRQDLIRFGQFSDAGIWQWKGGIQAGKVTTKIHDIYPIPANELSANPNVKQNPGY